MDISGKDGLSSGHTDDERLPATEQQGKHSLYRLVEGLRLQKLYPEAKLIFSGYEYRGQRPNSEVSKEAAIILGANPENIILLNGAKDTIEESIAIKKVVRDEPILLVTSASHMKRSMLIFKKLNLNAIAAPTNYLSHEEKSLKEYFSGKNIRKIEIAIHEYLGLIWYKIKGYI